MNDLKQEHERLKALARQDVKDLNAGRPTRRFSRKAKIVMVITCIPWCGVGVILENYVLLFGGIGIWLWGMYALGSMSENGQLYRKQ